jgi:hypothetical protein
MRRTGRAIRQGLSRHQTPLRLMHLLDSDLDQVRRIFHEHSRFYFTDGEIVTDLPRETYFDRPLLAASTAAASVSDEF